MLRGIRVIFWKEKLKMNAFCGLSLGGRICRWIGFIWLHIRTSVGLLQNFEDILIK